MKSINIFYCERIRFHYIELICNLVRENKVEELFNNPDIIKKMQNKTAFLSKPDAAKKIATEIRLAIK